MKLVYLILNFKQLQVRNVARCWTYETSVCVDKDLSNELPYNTEYFEYFSPDFSLHPEASPRQENGNARSYLDAIVQTTHDNLKMVAHAPSVQMQDTPRAPLVPEDHGNLDELDPDGREARDLEEEQRTQHEGEFYDNDRDQDGDDETTGGSGGEGGGRAESGGGGGGGQAAPAEAANSNGPGGNSGEDPAGAESAAAAPGGGPGGSCAAGSEPSSAAGSSSVAGGQGGSREAGGGGGSSSTK